MFGRTCQKIVLGPAALAAVVTLACSVTATAATVSPLPPSDYAVRAACPAPTPTHASCLALELVAVSAQARAHTHPLGIAHTHVHPAPSPAEGYYGLTPADLHTAYGLPNEAPSSQTIALVDAYNDPNAEADLKTYDEEFGLPECTTANHCFKKVNQNGESTNLPFPQTQGELEAARTGSKAAREAAAEASGWAIEISLDIETAHAICQNCKIVLVEADSPAYSDLEAAEETAVALGATEISNSWGGPECFEGVCLDDSPAFDHAGVVITASAGDRGYLNWLEEPRISSAGYPASSPHVIAVGGTRLNPLGAEGEWTGETVWNDGGMSEGHVDGYGAGGGGCSATFPAPSWQLALEAWSAVGCSGGHRAVADVSADADPYSGLAVYDSQGIGGEEWAPIGGTSLASPLIAAAFALAGGAHGVQYPARSLYENAATSPASLHDVTSGSNGECLSPFDEGKGESACSPASEGLTSCASHAICLAGEGYDGPSGVGTPNGLGAFAPGVAGEGEDEGPEPSGSGGGEGPAGKGQGSGGETGGTTTGGSGTPSASPGAPSGIPSLTLNTDVVSVHVSALALTANALVALNRTHPRVSQLAFAFTVNLTSRVSVSLARRVRARGHAHWQAVGTRSTIAAAAGHNSRRMAGHAVLRPGVYRLTLAPIHGNARSLTFAIG